MEKENIILTGMPGAGKSTIGIVLAKVMGYDFVDPDLLIQKEKGKFLWQIIDEVGIEGFNAIEEEVNSKIQAVHSVIAPGGSVVYGPRAMEHLKSIGTVVYLDVDLELLEKRIGNLERRGVVKKTGQTLKHLYDERLPLYHKYADVIIHENNDSISETVASIVEEIGKLKKR
ncbi:MAG: shikimate kinase [Eubacteriales bacterium]|nr:shikimate kinase [Eubacteriales bacterium]